MGGMMPFKDPKKRTEAVRKSQAKRPEHYHKLRQATKHRAARRGYAVSRRYGITEAEFQALVTAQQDKCALCGKKQKPTKSGRTGLYVDHCHQTHEVRGLLCPRCNLFMGFVDDERIDIAQLTADAIQYASKVYE
jgi:hypothetical protein